MLKRSSSYITIEMELTESDKIAYIKSVKLQRTLLQCLIDAIYYFLTSYPPILFFRHLFEKLHTYNYLCIMDATSGVLQTSKNNYILLDDSAVNIYMTNNTTLRINYENISHFKFDKHLLILQVLGTYTIDTNTIKLTNETTEIFITSPQAMTCFEDIRRYMNYNVKYNYKTINLDVLDYYIASKKTN